MHTPAAAAIGDLIARAIAADPDLNQSKFATVLGRHQTSVSRWIRGLNHPERELWPAIEQALNLDEGAIEEAYRGAAPMSTPASDLSALYGRIDELERTVARLAALLESVDE